MDAFAPYREHLHPGFVVRLTGAEDAPVRAITMRDEGDPRWYVCYDGQDRRDISPRFALHSQAIAWGVQWAEEDPTNRAFYALKDLINDPLRKEKWNIRLMLFMGRWWNRRFAPPNH